MTVGRNEFRNQSSDPGFANLFTMLYLNVYSQKTELMEASHHLRRLESEDEAALEVTLSPREGSHPELSTELLLELLNHQR